MSSFRPILVALLLAASPAWGQSEIERGRLLVEANCRGCHAIGLADASPHPDAPPFRTLSERYPIDSLAETLTKGIPTKHPDMPDFLATASQIDEITAYILSLQPQ
jgi:mono/diheme cytochrome c family protein